jgi:SAM-dependent methyltransferase
MTISDIANFVAKPSPFARGTAQMWTDEHISKQLLEVHLNPEMDLASRKPVTIENTINWILSRFDDGALSILDLGCGPGLYTERLASDGHRVTGVDFSERSIDHARASAERQSLDIQYIRNDYLKLDLEDEQFDLIMMIYTDFGVLHPDEQNALLAKVKRALRPGGVFIFDVLNGNDPQCKSATKSWDYQNGGFWKDTPYMVLTESFYYTEEDALLYKHIVIGEDNSIDVYNFWTRFFSHKLLDSMLLSQGFGSCSFHEDVLPEGDMWSGNNVTFCVASVER